MTRFMTLCAVLLSCLFTALPASADDTPYEIELARQWQLLPDGGVILRHPDPKAWQVYGMKKQPKLVPSKDAIGGKALRIKVRKAKPNPWDIGVQAATQDAVLSNDVILGAFWARAVDLPNTAANTAIPFGLQMSEAPYTAFASQTAILSSDWNVYYISGTAPRDFKKGGLQLSLQVGGAEHTIELGPVYLWSLGPGKIDPSQMPQSSQMPQNSQLRNQTPLSPLPAAPSNPATRLDPKIKTDLAKIMAHTPYQATLMNTPDMSLAGSFGDSQSGHIVSDAGVPGGKAYEIKVGTPGLNGWSAGVNWPIHSRIHKGDTVLLAYWAKAGEVHNESQSGIISAARVQQSSEPYDSAVSQAASVDKKWRLYYAQGRSASDIEPGPSGVSFHMGLAKQTLRIGPTYILNYGPDVSPETLPQTRLVYDGMEPGALWRTKAMANIDKHRKADLGVNIVDGNGQPVPDMDVEIRMTQHAFGFGSFIGHEFVKSDGQINAAYHNSFHDNFNMATAPLYWQDWGWNGDDSNESDYRATIKHLHANNIRWRGHPIIWPGESYMPSRIKDANGNLQKQRRLVMDHIREVMSFVKDYDPVAIDMVNEVRTNRYFSQHGDAELVKDAFRLAHEISPDTPLFVNDYGILNSGGFNQKNIEFYHEWIRNMQRDKVPLGGIGFQAHFGAGLTPPARIIDILDEFSIYGLPLHITEFDVDTLDRDAQAAYMRDMLIAAFSQPDVEAFIIWGWWEGDHWKPNAAMLNKDWSSRPSHQIWKDLIYRQWWTKAKLKTGPDGRVQIRGFKGQYDITVNGTTQSYMLSGDDILNITL